MDTLNHVVLNHDRCFVCGKKNPKSLGVSFVSVDGVTNGEFTTREGLESLGGVTHGGILTTLMDAAMARWLYDRRTVAFTAVLKARFRKAVPPGRKLRLEAKRTGNRGRRHYMECRIYDDSGREVASAEALFYQIKQSQELNEKRSETKRPGD
jgi:acyl-coenzyme A thioesterase PaaI-like protein